MNTFRTLVADFNRGVTRARTAYTNDAAVNSGLCATCHRNRRDGHMRRCWTCRHNHTQETP